MAHGKPVDELLLLAELCTVALNPAVQNFLPYGCLERVQAFLKTKGTPCPCPCTFISMDGCASCGVHKVNMRHTQAGWICPVSAWTFPFGTPISNNYDGV